MKKTLKPCSINSLEKNLVAISGKINLPLMFTDLDGNRIMSCVSTDHLLDTKVELINRLQVPVIVNGELIGNISAYPKNENLESLLQLAAYSIENSLQLEDEIEDLSAEIVRVYEELSLIYSLSSKLGSDLDINSICQQVVEEISKVLDVHTILILLLDEMSGMLSIQSSTGIDEGMASSFNCDCSWEPFAQLLSCKKATVITSQITNNSFPISLQDALCVPLVTDSRTIGILIARDKTTAKEFLTPEIKLIDALSGEIAGAIKKAQLYERINRLFINTVEALASAIDAKDPYTYGHSRRVAQISSKICREIGMKGEEINSIKLAALLHDVGKIGTPEYILQKPERLHPEEMEKIKEHPQQGAQILSSIDELKDVVEWIKDHHERYDGKGYPGKISANNIPMPARIISIADSFDAMTSDRPYRKAMDPAKAMDIMDDLAGSQFDPGLFKAFKSVFFKEKTALI